MEDGAGSVWEPRDAAAADARHSEESLRLARVPCGSPAWSPPASLEAWLCRRDGERPAALRAAGPSRWNQRRQVFSDNKVPSRPPGSPLTDCQPGRHPSNTGHLRGWVPTWVLVKNNPFLPVYPFFRSQD